MPALRRKLPSVAPALMIGTIGTAGPELRRHVCLDRAHDFLVRAEGALNTASDDCVTLIWSSASTRSSVASHFVNRLARHDAAIDAGARHLRQSVDRMAAFQHRGDAGRAQLRIVDRIGRQPQRRAAGSGGAATSIDTHIVSGLLRSRTRAMRAKKARVVSLSLNGKVNLRSRVKPLGQLIDGVVAAPAASYGRLCW